MREGLKALEQSRTMSAALRAFQDSLEALPPVNGVERGLEFREYDSGPVLAVWVDAALRDGRTVVWWMDVTVTSGGMALDRRISESGRDTIVRFATVDLRPGDSFEAATEEALRALLSTRFPELQGYLDP